MAKKRTKRPTVAELLREVKELRAALDRNSWAVQHNAYWTTQAARGKDSAGNWR